MQTLLVWALRFVEDFATDIMSAHAEHTRLHALSPELIRRPAGQQKRGGYLPGQLRRAVIDYLDKLRTDGGHLPGHLSNDGKLQIDWRHIERLFVCSAEIRRNGTGRLIIESGLPIDSDIPLDVSVTGLLEGSPWRSSAIGYHEAPRLARLLSTACFIVIAYLSGARPGEVLSLRRGCLRKDPETGMLLMGGLYYKNAVDADGNKIPQGAERADPWVVVAPVARAIEVLEELHSSELLFPTYIESYRRPTTRLGAARDVQSASEDITDLTQWINAYCARLERTDRVPDDRHGALSPPGSAGRWPGSSGAAHAAWSPPPSSTAMCTSRCSRVTPAPTIPASPTNTPSRTGCTAWRPWLRTNAPWPPVSTSAGPPPTPTDTA